MVALGYGGQTSDLLLKGSVATDPKRAYERLFDSSRKAAERADKISTKRVDSDDDYGGNTSGARAVFNCRGATLTVGVLHPALRHA